MSAATLRAEGAGDSTPGSDNGERITRLFPKCRPKTMQHPRDRLNTGLDGRNDLTSINNLSSDEEHKESDGNLVILNSKGGTYKLRDSRIIEIAGGRELYSQSRTKAVRKLRHSATHKHNLRNKVRSMTKDCGDYVADNLNTELSLHRILNQSETKKVSRHTSPSYTNGDRESALVDSGLGIPRNSSPILDPHKKTDVSAKCSPIAVVADGEVVVLDDNEDWKGLRMDADISDNDIDMSVKRTLDNMKNGGSDIMNNKGDSCDGSDSTPSREERLSDGSGGAWLSGDEDRNRVTRVIGELPIAEYEGSPRRYGVGSQIPNTNAAKSPRPGFPQRVMTDSRDITPPSSSAAFDYLYEFSETRKVLEEFFRCPAMAGHQQTASDEVVNFQELDYELRRQTQRECNLDSNGAATELEWSRVVDTLDSPHATLPHNHTNFLGLQQREREHYTRSPNVHALSAECAWSGSASPGVRPSRARAPFVLSPDTSESDSRAELDSDLHTMLMENELSELKGITECSRGGVSVHLPVVEDGLSSGHASDTDNNNQMQSLQNHSNVIIEEIVENGTAEPHVLSDADLHSLDPLACSEVSPPPPAPAPHRPPDELPAAAVTAHATHAPHPPHAPLTPHAAHAPLTPRSAISVINAHVEVEPAYATNRKRPSSAQSNDSVEVKPASGDEDEADTDLETDRLLGQQRTDDQGFFDDKGWRKPKSRTVMPAGSVCDSARSPPHAGPDVTDGGEDGLHNNKDKDNKKKSKNKEAVNHSVLIEGVLFRARYLGSTQLACEGQPTKATRMLQAEEAVSRIKAPEGENQPSTEVDLFISTEKIMVLNTELKEIMMDHALRTISYIADIGDLVVLMARRRFVPHETDSDQPKLNRTPKMICHVFESEEAQFIAQSIGQAFQVAYMEFLKANGIEDHSFVKEMDYQEVLNSQEIFGDELQMFAKKELQKEVVVPKTKGEILGVVVVESGWGSMLPTVVIANLAPAGAAARCGQLNIGDQIIAINGVSLVGLPLSTCQTYIKNSKNQTVVKLTVVPCAPVVEVKIKRPDTKYQLGFSVQNGVICSLLRGGIAERGGVRVGHRIIEINSQSVVAVPHERIVNLLATSVGEILMKTMPTSMFRLLTGQENPVFI